MTSTLAANVAILGSPEGSDPRRVGGKAASLTRLLSAGLPVPEGFVVTTHAHSRAMGGAGLREWIADQVASVDVGAFDALARVAREIQHRVGGVALPPGLEGALRAAWGDLAERGSGPLRVAVRSSATLEDLPEASFAGQHASFLQVSDPEDLLARVKDCWASLYTARAIAYRHRLGLGDEEVLAAVVVQRMVETEVAGVLFTADPTTGSVAELRVEASWGLGEGVVSGHVDPDSFRLDPATGEVLEQRVGGKALRVVGDGAGTRQEETPPALRAVPCVRGAELAALARVARAATATFGGPLDLEWGLRGGELFLFQARPITTLGAVSPTDEGGVRVLTNANFAETMPEPPSPLGWSLLVHQLEDVLLPPSWARPLPTSYRLATLVRGRPYWDVTPALGAGLLWPLFRDVSLRFTDRATALACERLRERHRFPSALRPLLQPRGLWRALLYVFLWLPLFLVRILRTWAAPRDALERVDAAQREMLALLEGRPPDAASAREHAAAVTAVLPRVQELSRDVVARAFLAAMACAGQVVVLCRLWLGRRDAAEVGFKLAAGRSGNHTLRMGLRLWYLSRSARQDQEVRRLLQDADADTAWRRLQEEHGASHFMEELRAFLEEYGHRGPGEQDLGVPRWAEAPETLLPFLRGAVRVTDGPQSPMTRRARTLEEYASLRATCEEDLRRSWILPRLRLAMFRWLLGRSEQLFPMREDLKHLLFQVFARLRRRFLGIGRALAREGHLRHPEDVWYLEADELLEWVAAGCPEAGRVRGRVLRRRMERERQRSLRPPIVVSSAGDEVYPEAEEGLDTQGRLVLQGEPGSRGRVGGRARVLADPRQGHLLEPGEILVAPYTDPGWTPLFMVAAGLVMDVGGTISHGVITAREYGIPAVVGLGDATRRIRDGQWLTLDGARGTVRLEEDDETQELMAPAPRDSEAA